MRRLLSTLAVCIVSGLFWAPSLGAADIRVIQLDRFDDQHNGSIDVDIGVGHNLGPDAPILCNLLLEGPIERGDLDRLKALIDRQRETEFTDTPRLCLHSPGGSYAEGLALARYLMEKSIGTAVPENGECYSACAIIFMGGTYPWKGELNRFLHTQAVLGFHAPYIPDRNDKKKVMVDENEVRVAFSDGIQAMRAFMRLGVGNPVKRILPELMEEMMAQGPNDFFFVDTVGKAIRYRIHLFGIDRPAAVDATGICNACVNMNYGAYERYGRGGELDLCKGLSAPERRSFPGGERYTNDVAPRGGDCSVDVAMSGGRIKRWIYRNDDRAAFGDGLELAHWFLFSPSTPIASLSKPEPGRGGGAGTSDGAGDPEGEQRRRDRFLRELFNFVVVEYLGHGRPDHRGRADLFADRVDYYKKGVIGRQAVLADKAAYYKRWPKRRYEVMTDSVEARRGRGDTIDVRFRYAFEVSNDKETRRGIGVARLGVTMIDGKFSIVSEDGEVERRQ